MKCNGCWTDIEPRTQAVASSCGHLLCLKCAQSIIESDGACPVCESLITKSTVKLVTILQEVAACRLHLCGQTPETALNSALASVNFYLKQQMLHFEMKEEQFKKKLHKMQDQCKQKLAEVHTGYKTAKRKYQEVLEEKNTLERDIQELQQKYSQKASQTRKLQEMLQNAKSENEMLRTSTGSRNTKQSINHALSPPVHQTTMNFDQFKAKHMRSSPTHGLDEFDPKEQSSTRSHHQRQGRKRTNSKARSNSIGNPEHFSSSSSRHKRAKQFNQFLADNTIGRQQQQTGNNFISSLGGSPGRMASF